MGRETRPRVSNCCLTLRPPESGRRAVPFPSWGSQFNFVSFLLGAGCQEGGGHPTSQGELTLTHDAAGLAH